MYAHLDTTRGVLLVVSFSAIISVILMLVDYFAPWTNSNPPLLRVVDKFTINNVPNNSRILWLHYVTIWLISALTIGVTLRSASRRATLKRKSDSQCRTLMMKRDPKISTAVIKAEIAEKLPDVVCVRRAYVSPIIDKAKRIFFLL